MYYQDELYKSKNNAFKTWKVIKLLLSCSQNSSTTPNAGISRTSGSLTVIMR